uniref:Uncharacterized protein n=1 Tax=Anguilla anguilla TaxID=7936 RepID=A0A0E9W7M6_ANGAN
MKLLKLVFVVTSSHLRCHHACNILSSQLKHTQATNHCKTALILAIVRICQQTTHAKSSLFFSYSS